MQSGKQTRSWISPSISDWLDAGAAGPVRSEIRRPAAKGSALLRRGAAVPPQGAAASRDADEPRARSPVSRSDGRPAARESGCAGRAAAAERRSAVQRRAGGAARAAPARRFCRRIRGRCRPGDPGAGRRCARFCWGRGVRRPARPADAAQARAAAAALRRPDVRVVRRRRAEAGHRPARQARAQRGGPRAGRRSRRRRHGPAAARHRRVRPRGARQERPEVPAGSDQGQDLPPHLARRARRHARLHPRRRPGHPRLHPRQLRLPARGRQRGRRLPPVLRRARLHPLPVPVLHRRLGLEPLAHRLARQAAGHRARLHLQHLHLDLPHRVAVQPAGGAQHRHLVPVPVYPPRGSGHPHHRSAQHPRVLPDGGHGRVGRPHAAGQQLGGCQPAQGGARGRARGPKRPRGQGGQRARRPRGRGRGPLAQHHHLLARRHRGNQPDQQQRLWERRGRAVAGRVAVDDQTPDVRGPRLPPPQLRPLHPPGHQRALGPRQGRHDRRPLGKHRSNRAQRGHAAGALHRRPPDHVRRGGRHLCRHDQRQHPHPRLQLCLPRRRPHQRAHPHLDAQHHLRRRPLHHRRRAQPGLAGALLGGRVHPVPGRGLCPPPRHLSTHRDRQLQPLGRRRHLDPPPGQPRPRPPHLQRRPPDQPGHRQRALVRAQRHRAQRADEQPPREGVAGAGGGERGGGELQLQEGAAGGDPGAAVRGDAGGDRGDKRGVCQQRVRRGGRDGVERGGDGRGDEQEVAAGALGEQELGHPDDQQPDLAGTVLRHRRRLGRKPLHRQHGLHPLPEPRRRVRRPHRRHLLHQRHQDRQRLLRLELRAVRGLGVDRLLRAPDRDRGRHHPRAVSLCRYCVPAHA